MLPKIKDKRYNTRSNDEYENFPRPNEKYYKSFFPHFTRSWNNLDKEIREDRDHHNFKEQMKIRLEPPRHPHYKYGDKYANNLINFFFLLNQFLKIKVIETMPPWQFWIEGGIGPRDASTTPIGPQRTAHLAAVEKTCTPSEIKEVNSCFSLCLKKLFVTNSEKKKTIFKYGMPTTRQQGWQFFVEPKQFQITHWFWPTTLKSIWNWPTDMMVQFELNH